MLINHSGPGRMIFCYVSLRRGEIHHPSALHGENLCGAEREGKGGYSDETSSVFLRGLEVVFHSRWKISEASRAPKHDIIRNCGANDGACTIKRALRVCRDAGDWGVCVDLLRMLF